MSFTSCLTRSGLRRGPGIALCLLPLVFLTGCATIAGSFAGNPKVTLEAIRPMLEESPPRVVLALAVDNPRSHAIELSQLDWELWFEGRYFAAGTQAVAGRVSARERGLVEFELPVMARFATLTGPRDVLTGARGFVHLEGPGLNQRVHFEGELRLRRVMAPGLTSEDEP